MPEVVRGRTAGNRSRLVAVTVSQNCRSAAPGAVVKTRIPPRCALVRAIIKVLPRRIERDDFRGRTYDSSHATEIHVEPDIAAARAFLVYFGSHDVPARNQVRRVNGGLGRYPRYFVGTADSPSGCRGLIIDLTGSRHVVAQYFIIVEIYYYPVISLDQKVQGREERRVIDPELVSEVISDVLVARTGTVAQRGRKTTVCVPVP